MQPEKNTNPEAFSVAEFKNLMTEDATVLDSRNRSEFTGGFIPGSVHIGLDGNFEEWTAGLLPVEKPVLLVTEAGKDKETILRLARAGINRVLGFLDGGFAAWKNAGEKTDMIVDIEPDELLMDIPFDKNLVVLDVRKPDEFAEGHLPGAVNLPLNEMTDPGSMSPINEEDNLYIHSGKEYRSVIAASLLKRQGIHNLRYVVGGWSRIKELEKVNIVKEKGSLN